MQPEKEGLANLCALFRGENLVYFNKIIQKHLLGHDESSKQLFKSELFFFA